MNGRNFLIDINGKPKKHGFYQNIVVEADSPKQAELLAIAKIRRKYSVIPSVSESQEQSNSLNFFLRG